MKIINNELLDKLTGEAAESSRKRKNFNFHSDYADPCQRLLNAVEPGSYIRPHRHLSPPKPETFLIVRGKMALFLFDDEGDIERCVLLSAAEGAIGIDIPSGVWHSLVSLESGSVFFETKPGPYEPLPDQDLAPWAPLEGSPGAEEYLKGLEKAVKSEK
ncbi:MAG: WbuC family cupin fold metalloprotein [Desulfuromonadales bacterium]